MGQVHLDCSPPYMQLNAGDEKSGHGAEIPIREDLAADLRDWIHTAQEEFQDNQHTLTFLTSDVQETFQKQPLFYVPSGLIRILDRDLELAGIPKTDERGRTVDVHALRHTFGTHLSKGGVAPRTAQSAMRHSDISLTMGVYTDPKLLDVHGALDSLPTLPLNGPIPQENQATGTDDSKPIAKTPNQKSSPFSSPNPGSCGQIGSNPDNSATDGTRTASTLSVDVSGCQDKEKPSSSTAENEGQKERVTGLEPATFSLGS